MTGTLGTYGGDFFNPVDTRIAQIVTVGKSGAQFTTIQAAIDSITDAGPTKIYAVQIFPGLYTENVVGKNYVILIGLGEATVLFNTTGPLYTAPNVMSTIQELTLVLTPSTDGQSIISHSAGDFFMFNCPIVYGSTANGVGSSLFNVSGGRFYCANSTLRYDANGDSAGAVTHRIFNFSGSTTQAVVSGMLGTLDIADQDDTFVFCDSNVSGTAQIFLKSNSVEARMSNVAYSGNSFFVRSVGSAFKLISSHNTIHLDSDGNGIGCGYCINSGGAGEEVHSEGNHLHIEGFATNYSARAQDAADIYNSHFDEVTAVDGVGPGSGTHNLVNSPADGELQVTEKIYGGVADGDNLELTSTKSSVRGTIQLNDKLDIFRDEAVQSPVTFRYIPDAILATQSPNFVIDALNLSPNIDVSLTVWIYSLITGAGTYNQLASTAFSAFLFMRAIPTLVSSDTSFNPLSSGLFYSGPITKVDNAGGNCGTVQTCSSFIGVPRVHCTSNLDQFTLTHCHHSEFSPRFQTDHAGATINVTNTYGLEVNDWALINAGLGTHNFTNFFGIKIADLSTATANFGLHSNISAAALSWFIYNLGGADSFMGGDNAEIFFGTSLDASIQYNGANLVINPKVVGSGQCVIGAAGAADLRASIYSSVPDTQSVTAAGGISHTSSIIRVAGSGGAVDITRNPQIDTPGTAYDGSILIVEGTSDVNTVKLDNGNGLALSGSITLANSDSIMFQYNYTKSLWIEVSRTTVV